MRSSFVSMIQSILEFRFISAIAVIFQVNISVLPLSAKNAFVTAYLLESFIAQFKNVVCCFQTILCFLSFKEGKNRSPQPLIYFDYFLSYEREQEVHKCSHPQHFRVSSIKISNVVTKETSQILLQTL